MFGQHIGKRKSYVAVLPCRKSLRFNPIGQEVSPTHLSSPTVIIRGTARLFHQVSSKSGECVMQVIKKRMTYDECTGTQNAIHHSNECSTYDTSIAFIDNTNLDECYNPLKVTDNEVAAKKMGRPTCIISLDCGKTWQLVVLLHIHPHGLLYSHARYDSDSCFVVSDNVVEMSMMDDTIHKTFKLHYVNRITEDRVCSFDHKVECNVRGPDMFRNLSDNHIKHIKRVVTLQPSILKIKKKDSLLSDTKTCKEFDGSRRLAADKTLARKKRLTHYVDTPSDDMVLEKHMAIALRPEDDTKSHVHIALLHKDKLDDLKKKADYSNSEEGKIDINKFNRFLRVNATRIDVMPILRVPNEGIVLEQTTLHGKVGTEQCDSRIEPVTRVGPALVQWSKFPQKDYSVDLHDELLDFMMTYSFGTGPKRNDTREILHSIGTCKFFGRNTSSRPFPNPRKGRSSVNKSCRWTDIPDPVFIPLINHIVSSLTVEANGMAKASDPILDRFYQKIWSLSSDWKEVQCNNKPADRYNELHLFTGPLANGDALPVRGYANSMHIDKNDCFQRTFNKLGENHLIHALNKCLTPGNEERKLFTIEAILHILRLGKGDGKRGWNLQATCGYLSKYKSNANNERRRGISALFIYNGIQRAINIPTNRVSYMTWDTSVLHQTSLPYTFGKLLECIIFIMIAIALILISSVYMFTTH